MTAFQWVSISEAARELNKSRPTIYNWIENGDLPQPITKGHTRYFKRSTIERMKRKLSEEAP